MALTVQWVKCGDGGVWCALNDVNLTDVTAVGVYTIWHGSTNRVASRYVYVGQGIIKDRLTAHRIDKDIQAYAQYGLYVTWASVGTAADRDGAELYLAQQCNPLVGHRYPSVLPIAVNLPA